MKSIWMERLPGLFLTIGITLLAFQIHRLPFFPFTIDAPKPHPVDAILIAILLSMLFKNLFSLPIWLKAGIQYSAKGLLPLGIVLLGAKLNFFHILKVSSQSLAISSVCVVVALGLTYWLCLKAGVPRKLGFLIGVGTAICGGTAIVVISPAIEADDNDTALSVATVTLFGMAAIFIFPILGNLLEMSQYDFGVWAGIAVHATPQVLAAGFSYGNVAGEISTIVKLIRVLMLAPLTIITVFMYARHQRSNQKAYVSKDMNWKSLLPPFILGFLFVALANTFHLFPPITFHLEENFLWQTGAHRLEVTSVLSEIAKYLITVAMAGIGFGIDLKTIRKTGFTPLYVGMFAAVILTLFSLMLIKLFL